MRTLLWTAALLAHLCSASNLQATVRFQHVGDLGLSHSSIYALQQDQDGFIWIGTVDGLNRFDGYTYRVFRHDPNLPDTISNNLIYTILAGDGNWLWLGTGNGLDRFDTRTGRSQRYVFPGQAPAPSVSQLIEVDEQDLGLATSAGFFICSKIETRCRLQELTGHQLSLEGLAADERRGLWFLNKGKTGLHLLECPPGSFQCDSHPLTVPAFSLSSDSRGRIWLGGSTYATGAEGIRHRPLITEEAGGWSATTDLQGHVWVGTEKGIVQHPADGSSPIHHLPDPTPGAWLSNYVRSLLTDTSGAIWAGSQGGLYRYDPQEKPFRVVRHNPRDPDSLSTRAVSAISKTPDGALWVGTFGGGLNRIRSGKEQMTHFRHQRGDPAGLPGDIVWSLLTTRSGHLWVGGAGWICKARRDLSGFDCADLGEEVERVGMLLEDSAGDIWAATSAGLVKVWAKTLRVEPVSSVSGLPVESMSLDEESGTLWFGTGGAPTFVASIDPAAPQRPLERVAIEPGVLEGEGVWDLFHDTAANRIWLGTGGGLIELKLTTGKTRKFTTHDGLPGSVVYSILGDETGALWLATNLGLSRITLEEDAPRFHNFSKEEGTGNTEFNRNARYRSPDGEFFFGGMEGVTRFFPSQMENNPFVPPIVITSIQRSNREGTFQIRVPEAGDTVELLPDDNSFVFQFAALNYSNPAANRYSYRLEGFESGWSDTTHQRVARYTNIPPGNYIFRVRGSNNDGVWNEKGATVAVSILPAFWQTAWFRVALATLLLAALGVGYRFRIAQILRVERMRLRIAGDLHDDLSSDLSGISLATEMVYRRAQLNHRDRDSLIQVQRSALQMVDSLREIVWYINPEHDNLEAMLRRMQRVAKSMLGDLEYEFRRDLPSENDARGSRTTPLKMTLRRDLFLIYKEALHNIVRHAQARSVSIQVSLTEGHFQVFLGDDGVGFDPSLSDTGHGLQSMRRRAEQIGARLSIESNPGSGTRLTISVPVGR